ncbi:MAG: hypothetical protein JNL11_12985 [Bdellovibrionaceae bacterium]|nr:hypothetical protein [Pseudobdellovibrionaceae bacterium]
MLKYALLLLLSCSLSHTATCVQFYKATNHHGYEAYLSELSPYSDLQMRRIQSSKEVEKIIKPIYEKMSKLELRRWKRTHFHKQSNPISPYVSALVLTKIKAVKTGNTKEHELIKKLISDLKIPIHDTDLTFLNISPEQISKDVASLLKGTEFYSKSKSIAEELFPPKKKLEKKVILPDQTEVFVYLEQTPNKIDTLHPDVLAGLKLLDQAYKAQATNTVDVLKDQEKMTGQPTYFLVAKYQNKIVGLMGIVRGDPKHPVSVSQFGIDNLGDVQIEFGKFLILRKESDLLTSMMQVGLTLMRTKSVDMDQTISFWVDLPTWARALMRMGAPRILTENKNIWVFQATFKQFLQKYERTAAKPFQEQL